MLMRALPTLVLVPLVATVLCLAGCKRSEMKEAPPSGVSASSDLRGPTAASTSNGGTARFDVKGVPLAESVVVGKPALFGNLTIFPILAKEQPDIGPFTSLDSALAKGTAEVRELGSQDLPPQQALPQQALPQQAANSEGPANEPVQRQGDQLQLAQGAQVGKLVIENKVDLPIYVLAGTIVKGGKQDRQIGQDFIIGAKATVPVDAFCVEHGRWNGQRQGAATHGKFKTVKQLANIDVRSAGQYEGNQGKVWSKVSAVNKANSKKSSSDSLLASLDDAEIAKQRNALAKKIIEHLGSVQPSGAVVGFSYAINGKIKGARWFVNHQVFSQVREVMVNTSAVDAITAGASGVKEVGPPLRAVAVARFVKHVQAVRERKVKETSADNVNEYAESDKGYGSTTVLKRPAKKPVKMSSDFVAK